MIEKKRKLKKSVLIPVIIVSVLIVLSIIFLIVGNVSLKLSTEEVVNDKITVNDSSFKYPTMKCTFLGKDISSSIKISKDIDVTKLGHQTLEYSCSKLLFSKTYKIEFDVVDNEKPEIKLNGEENMSLYLGSTYEEKGATAEDNYDGDLTSKIEIEGNVDTSVLGEYKINYKVIDTAGNENVMIRNITVKEKPAPLSCGEPGVIYLTFDDGPNSVYTPVILDVLKKYDVKATFFVTSAGPDELIKREFDEGHAIGIHSSTHDYAKIYASSEAFWNDMNIVKDRVYNITGQYPTLLRFPGGVSNTVSKKYHKGIMTQLAKEVEDNGYAYFDWNLSSGDAGGTTDPEVEFKNVYTTLTKTKGNVILMHDIKKHTSLAIENIVKYGIENGYKFDVLNKDIICHQRINN